MELLKRFFLLAHIFFPSSSNHIHITALSLFIINIFSLAPFFLVLSFINIYSNTYVHYCRHFNKVFIFYFLKRPQLLFYHFIYCGNCSGVGFSTKVTDRGNIAPWCCLIRAPAICSWSNISKNLFAYQHNINTSLIKYTIKNRILIQ